MGGHWQSGGLRTLRLRQTREESLEGDPKYPSHDDGTKDGVCLKCGKPNHGWSLAEWWSEDPTIRAEKEEPPVAALGRVIEIPDDIGEDLDIWA